MKASGPPSFLGQHLVVLGIAFLVGVAPEGRADPAPAAPQSAQDPGGLTELSPDELMRIEVTSVSRKPEAQWRAPAAVAVITRDDIRRSGVTTLVEALRLAP